jgi:mannose-6-phosphate isomerase-like protein (cupin superfamily)
MRLQLFTLTVVLAAAGIAQAQPAPTRRAPTDQSTYVSEAQLQGIMQSAPAGFSTRVVEGGVYSAAFIRLAKPDTPHAHGVWSEIFVIKQGSGVLTTGGTITGTLSNNSATHGDIFTDANGKPRAPQPAAPARTPRVVVPGDLSGTSVEGGHDQKVGPGDVILIPAGVAHVFTKVDQPIVYLDIKFPKAEYVKDLPGVTNGGN